MEVVAKCNTITKREMTFVISLFVFKIRIRQQLIFPGGYPPSIVSANSLYDRVRDGNGWSPIALSPKILFSAIEY